MTNYNFGEILLLRFPYSEGKGESKRPVILLAETDTKDIIVAKVTSTKPRGNYDIVITDWQEIDLLFPSIIRIDKLAALSKSRVIRKLGDLDRSYHSLIKDKIKQLFHLE